MISDTNKTLSTVLTVSSDSRENSEPLEKEKTELPSKEEPKDTKNTEKVQEASENKKEKKKLVLKKPVDEVEVESEKTNQGQLQEEKPQEQHQQQPLEPSTSKSFFPQRTAEKRSVKKAPRHVALNPASTNIPTQLPQTSTSPKATQMVPQRKIISHYINGHLLYESNLPFPVGIASLIYGDLSSILVV